MKQAEETKLVSASYLNNVQRAPGHQKSQENSDKTSELVFRLAFGFSYARELA
jgi:hypothetical protein